MIFIFGESFLIFCAVTLASLLFLKNETGMYSLFMTIWPKALLITVTSQVSLYFNDLYEFKNGDNITDIALRLIQSIGVTFIILALIYIVLPNAVMEKWIFFFSIFFLILFVVSWRLLYIVIINNKVLAEKTLMVGSGDLARDIIEEIQHRRDISYDVRSIVAHTNEKYSKVNFNGIPVHYGYDDICSLAAAEQVSSIIVAMDQKRGVMPCDQLLSCKTKGISIMDGENFYERITGKIIIDKVNPSFLIFSNGFVKSRISKFRKIITGFSASAFMLIFSAPLMILIAIAIKLDSKGPVLYKQERVGANDKIFTLYKFRSMTRDAEKETGPVWTCKDDPRITRVGKFIRKLRLDELPQLWNILKGDISFVGPRPERPFFVEKLEKIVPYYKERFTVKPGITGWAQIKYGYGASEKDALEKLKYDLYYIKNMSFAMDLIIVFHTFKIVLLGRGSR